MVAPPQLLLYTSCHQQLVRSRPGNKHGGSSPAFVVYQLSSAAGEEPARQGTNMVAPPQLLLYTSCHQQLVRSQPGNKHGGSSPAIVVYQLSSAAMQ